MVDMASLPVTPLTEEQYLQIERAAFEKANSTTGRCLPCPAVR
jgi:hypothetical protein